MVAHTGKPSILTILLKNGGLWTVYKNCSCFINCLCKYGAIPTPLDVWYQINSFQFDSSTAVYHASPFDCSDYYLAWFYDEYVSMLILRTVNSVQSRQLCFLKARQPFIWSDHVYRSTARSHQHVTTQSIYR